MTLGTVLALAFIAHLVGDYMLQNHWMATRKTSSSIPAAVHVLLYVLPFLVLTQDWRAIAVIGGTHFLIDRFRLAKYWVEFWGNGVEGQVIGRLMRLRGYELAEVLVKPYEKQTRWVKREALKRHKYVLAQEGIFGAHAQLAQNSLPRIEPAPPFLSVWLLILVDNTMHLAINAATLIWAHGA